MIENVLLLKLVHKSARRCCSVPGWFALGWPVLVVRIAIFALMIFKPTLW
jgi:hypothetical protein